MSKNYHLQIKNLSHRYNKQTNNDWSFKSLNFELKYGELIGLLGPSGCGKTSLLRLIAGFEQPISGSVSIHGTTVATSEFIIPPEKRKIGMVFQDYALFPHLNVWNNCIFGLKNKKNYDRATWLLELLELSPYKNRYPHELSGGQKQRLALARALAPGTSLVLLDEPFSNLDVEVRNRLRSELTRVLKSCNASGILVTHDPNEAIAICDRVAVMRDGEIHQCDSPKNILNKPKTTFVARFVLQMNVLSIKTDCGYYSTAFGLLSSDLNDKILNKDSLLVDEFSFEIEISKTGTAYVLSKEFLGSGWLLRIIYKKITYRIWHQIEDAPNCGDNCTISLKKNKIGLLFPGCVPFRIT